MPRLFAAVVPPAEALEHLDAFREPRRAAADFRWARPEHFHITVAFMAAAAEHRVEEYVDRLAASLDGLAVADLCLTGAVAFPNVAEGRVLAIGVVGEAPLAQVAQRARNAAVASGIAVDGQRFRPHLTVARPGVADGPGAGDRLAPGGGAAPHAPLRDARRDPALSDREPRWSSSSPEPPGEGVSRQGGWGCPVSGSDLYRDWHHRQGVVVALVATCRPRDLVSVLMARPGGRDLIGP